MTILDPALKTGVVMIRFSCFLHHSQYSFNMGSRNQRITLPLNSVPVFVHKPALYGSHFVPFIQCKSGNLRKYNITFDLATE